MIRKETIVFNISVEGKNCETMYFEYLAKLINNSGLNKYNLKVSPKKMLPSEYAKRISYKPLDKIRGKSLPYIHIQDMEDFHSETFRQKFYDLIDDMRRAEKDFGISYELGYSNYSFELWLLLHVTDKGITCTNRYGYLKSINHYFDCNFRSLDDFKQSDNFSKILEKYVTLNSVFAAIHRAEKLTRGNHENRKTCMSYNKFKFYCDNPDTTVHEVVKIILNACCVKENPRQFFHERK